MSAISKDDVLNLREKTGAGLIDCKRALVESGGDLDEAVSILRKKELPLRPKKQVGMPVRALLPNVFQPIKPKACWSK